MLIVRLIPLIIKLCNERTYLARYYFLHWSINGLGLFQLSSWMNFALLDVNFIEERTGLFIRDKLFERSQVSPLPSMSSMLSAYERAAFLGWSMSSRLSDEIALQSGQMVSYFLPRS